MTQGHDVTMAAAAPPTREEMAASVFQQELKTVLHWFSTWSHYQRKDFLSDLVNKAVPPDVTTLFDAMQTLKVNDKAPSIYQCQLKLFTDWFQEWSEVERTLFLTNCGIHIPEQINNKGFAKFGSCSCSKRFQPLRI